MTKKEKEDLKKRNSKILRRKVRRAKTKETRGKFYDNSM